MTEASILSVQECGIGLDNKELAAGTVIVVGTRHGYGAADMGDVVLHAVLGKLALNILIRAAGAVALGIAALNPSIIRWNVSPS